MKQWILLAGTVGLALCVKTLPALASDSASAETSALPDPGSVWNWKVQPTVGSRYVMRTFSRTQMQMSGLPSAPASARRGVKTPTSVSITSQSSSVADYDVLSRDAAGATTIKLTYRSFGSSSSTVAPGASPQSMRAAQSGQSKMLNDIFVGSSLTMKIAPDGRVWSVLGLDQLRARMMRAFAAMPGGGAAVQMLGKDFLSEDSYKKSLAQSIGQLPPHAIAPGDSWPYAISLPMPMGLSSGVQGTRTLVARRDGAAIIKESGTFSMTQNPSAQPSGAPGLAPSTSPAMPRMMLRFQGAINGATTINEATGLPQEANASMTMAGQMSMEDPRSASSTRPKPGASASMPPITMKLSARIFTRTVMEPVQTPNA